MEYIQKNNAFDKLVVCLKKKGILKKNTENLESEILRHILAIPDDIATTEDILTLFGDKYTPGTFTIAERKEKPFYLYNNDNINYKEWLNNIIYQDLYDIWRVSPELHLDDELISKIIEDIIDLLEFPLSNGKALGEMIYNQEYTDIIRRIINIFLTGDPEAVFDTYKDYKEIGKKVAILVLKELQKEEHTIFDYFKLSIASGLIGLDMKSTASAASVIILNNIIPLTFGKCLRDKVSLILNKLKNIIKKKMAISFWPEYKKEIIKNQETICLCSITDDYIETIFQMKFHEKLLEINSNINIYLVPRYNTYGNDASYHDVISFIEDSILNKLKGYQKSGRYYICRNGPRVGTINGLKISREFAKILKKCRYVEVKGARAYEMLQGINKITYFMFAVCREISESVTGVNAESGRLVLIRQDAGINSFEGFKLRMNRIKVAPSGRKFGLSKSTAKDFSSAIRSKNYKDILTNFKNRNQANEWIKMIAQKEDKSFIEVIKHYNKENINDRS